MSIILTTVEELQEVGGDPAAVANSGFLYTKDALTITELFYRASDGTITQLTPPGGAGTTPWQRTGTTVALDQVGDTEVIPFDLVTGDDVTALGTTTRRWKSAIVGAGALGGFRVFDTSGGANPTSELKTALKFSAAGGAGALDIELARFGAKKFSVGDNAGGSGAIIPLTNVDPDGTLGDSTHSWRELWSRTLFMPDSAPVISLPLAGFGYLYAKNPGTGTVELFYQPSVGAAVQITPLGAASPWLRTGTIIAPDQALDTEVNPFADANTNQTSLGTSAIRWQDVNIAGAFGIWGPLGPVNPRVLLSTNGGGGRGALDFGNGGGTPVDARMRYAGTGLFDFSNPNAVSTSAGLIPRFDGEGGGVIGNATHRWAQFVCSGTYLINSTSGAANPRAQLQLDALKFGDGVLVVDVGIGRAGTTANTLEVSDGGILSGNLQPLVTATGKLGTTGVASSKAWLSVAVTGSYGVYNAAADANPTASLSATAVEFGPAGGPVDVGLKRSITAVNAIDVTNGVAGSGSIQPLVSGSGKIGIAGVPAARAFQSVAATGAFLVHTVASQAFPEATMTTTAAGGSVAMGPTGGAAAPDVEINWKSTGVIALKAGVASGSMVPDLDVQGSLGVNGVGGRIWASLSATSLAAYAAGVDVQPKVEMRSTLPGGEIRMGVGGVALNVPDVYLSRTSAGTLTVDDGAGNGITIVPSVNGTGNVGTAAKRFSLVRAVTITSGDVCFDDQTCQVCGQPFAEGDDLVLRVIRIEPDGDTGRKLTRTVPAHHGCR